MLLEDMEPIAKKFYDGVAEGKYLGRKCVECGAIEFPPHLGCNACGCADTEWVAARSCAPTSSARHPDFHEEEPNNAS